MRKKISVVVMASLMACLLAACGEPSTGDAETEGVSQDETDTSGSIVTNLEKIDMSKWMYHSDDNVYYQTGISYCEIPADTSFETLAVFVPGAVEGMQARRPASRISRPQSAICGI